MAKYSVKIQRRARKFLKSASSNVRKSITEEMSKLYKTPFPEGYEEVEGKKGIAIAFEWVITGSFMM